MSEPTQGTTPAASPAADITPAEKVQAALGGQNGAAPAQASDSQASTQPTSQTPNWDAPDNPYLKYRDQYNGLQGSFKATRAELEQMKVQMAQVRAGAEAEKTRLATEQHNRELDELLSQDEGPVAQKVKVERERQKAYEEWQRQHLPSLREQVEGQVYGMYNAGLRSAVQDDLTTDELGELARRGLDYTGYHQQVIRAAVEKRLQKTEGETQRRIGEAVKAAEARVRAEMRGQEVPPELSTGSVQSTSDQDFLREYAQGKQHDHKRAKALLGI